MGDAGMTTQTAYEAAVAYLRAGWTPTPLRGKIPTQKKWAGLKPSMADCWSWWNEDTRHDGVGIICGRISGNLVVVDIEDTLVGDPETFLRVLEAAGTLGVRTLIADAFTQACADTPSGGRHLYFTVTDSDTVPGNEKLAYRGTGDDAVLLAETRGEGGQVAAPPGGGRTWLGDSGAGKALAVTQAQLAAILDAFRSVNEVQRSTAPPREAAPYDPDVTRSPTLADAWTVALLDGRISWSDVLDPGWTFNGYDDDGRSLWVRPDYGKKTKALSSAKGFERYSGGAAPVLVVHSTSVPHLPSGGGQRLTPARVWAHCNFNGDEAAALAAFEAVVTSGDIDPRIVSPIPAAVLDEGARIARARAEQYGGELATYTPPEPEPDDGFWETRDYLRVIRQHARATRTSPDALLAVVLARTACEIGPHVTTPDLVGQVGSLNLFVGLVAESSGGKSSAIASVSRLRDWRADTVSLGSGEGLIHAFVRREKLKPSPDEPPQWTMTQHRVSVLAVVDEVDSLTALGSRQGATIMPKLREMWGGGTSGFGYADPTKAVEVQAHRYRLGVLVGIQPERASALLDDTGGGTPQRFIWAPTSDPQAPDVRPELPGPLPWRVPSAALTPRGAVTLEMHPEIYAEVDGATLGRLRGVPDSQDGHRLYSQIKVAALLGLLDGRLDMNLEDWAIARAILARSGRTRAKVERKLADLRIDELKGRSEAAARTAIHVEKRTQEAIELRVARSVARHIWKHQQSGGCSAKCMKPAVAGKYRRIVDMEAVMAHALDLGWVKTSERDGTAGRSERIVTFSPGKEKP